MSKPTYDELLEALRIASAALRNACPASGNAKDFPEIEQAEAKCNELLARVA